MLVTAIDNLNIPFVGTISNGKNSGFRKVKYNPLVNDFTFIFRVLAAKPLNVALLILSLRPQIVDSDKLNDSYCETLRQLSVS